MDCEYRYDLLSLEKRQIRLLAIDFSHDGRKAAEAEISNEVISCTLALYSLLDTTPPSYTALSYCWGDVSLTRHVSINGEILAITENLYKILQAFKNRGERSLLWIDAICINQKDDKEKSWQVEQMRDIYMKASSVIIWLGDATEDSHAAISTFAEVGDAYFQTGFSAWHRVFDLKEHTNLFAQLQASLFEALFTFFKLFSLPPNVFSDLFSPANRLGSPPVGVEEVLLALKIDQLTDQEHQLFDEVDVGELMGPAMWEAFERALSIQHSRTSEGVEVASLLGGIGSIRMIQNFCKNVGMEIGVFGLNIPDILESEVLRDDFRLPNLEDVEKMMRQALVVLGEVVSRNSEIFDAILSLQLPDQDRGLFGSERISIDEWNTFIKCLELNETETKEKGLFSTDGRTKPFVQYANGHLIFKSQAIVNFLKPVVLLICSLSSLEVLNSLLSQPWWQRVWVTQEFAVALEPVFMCGSRTISLKSMEGGLRAYSIFPSLQSTTKGWASISAAWFDWTNWETAFAEVGSKCRRSLRMFSFREKFWKDGDNILQLLRSACTFSDDRTSCMKATDPRDMIFAFLGLANDTSDLKLRPNYEKDYRDAYFQATKALLEAGHLTVLSFCQSSQKMKSLPSWVPDFSQPLKHPMACDLTFSASGKTRPRCSIDHIDDLAPVLTLGVLKVKKITAAATVLGDIHIPESTGGARVSDMFEFGERMVEMGFGDPDIEAELVSDFVISAGLTFDASQDPTTPIRTAWESFQTWLNIVEVELGYTTPMLSSEFDDLWRVLLSDRLITGQTPDGVRVQGPGLEAPERESWSKMFGRIQALFQREVDKGEIPATQTPVDEFLTKAGLKSAYDDLLGDFASACNLSYMEFHAAILLMRAICSQNEGRRPFRAFDVFGLGPKEAQPGDLVVIPIGSRVPFIVREIDSKHYCLIGEAYVHGLMDGELLKTNPERETLRLI